MGSSAVVNPYKLASIVVTVHGNKWVRIQNMMFFCIFLFCILAKDMLRLRHFYLYFTVIK